MGEGRRMDAQESGHEMTRGEKLDMMKRDQAKEEEESLGKG